MAVGKCLPTAPRHFSLASDERIFIHDGYLVPFPKMPEDITLKISVEPGFLPTHAKFLGGLRAAARRYLQGA